MMASQTATMHQLHHLDRPPYPSRPSEDPLPMPPVHLLSPSTGWHPHFSSSHAVHRTSSSGGHDLELPPHLPPVSFLPSMVVPPHHRVDHGTPHPAPQPPTFTPHPSYRTPTTPQLPFQQQSAVGWAAAEAVGQGVGPSGVGGAESGDMASLAGTNFLPMGGSLRGTDRGMVTAAGFPQHLTEEQAIRMFEHSQMEAFRMYGSLGREPWPASSLKGGAGPTSEAVGQESLAGPASKESRTSAARPPRKGQILHRNKACLSCRAKKTKCDALKPVCTSCKKLNLASECTYDQPPKWLEAVTRGARQARERKAAAVEGGGGTSEEEASGSAEDVFELPQEAPPKVKETETGEDMVVSELQKKIDELEQQLRDMKVTNASAAEAKAREGKRLKVEDAETVSRRSSLRPDMARSSSSVHAVFSSADPDETLLATSRSRDLTPRDEVVASWPSLPINGASPSASSTSGSSRSHNDASSKTSSSIHLSHLTPFKNESPDLSPNVLSSEPAWEPTPMEPEAAALLEDGWPKTLPDRKTCKLLLKAFFNRPLAPYMIMDTSKLLTRLHLAPSHPLFPQLSLLHAILAIGTTEVSLDALGPRPYWSRNAGGPAEYHAQWADKLCWEALSYEREPRALHENAQAAVVLGQWYQTKGMALLLWKSLGYALRVCTMLGYSEASLWDPNKRREWDDGVENIGPPVDGVDAYERATLFWYSVACERICCAVAGFAVSADEADVFAPITSLHANMPSWQAHAPHSDDFFVCHEDDVTGSLQLLTKASILVGRVTVFLQRANHPATGNDWIETEKKKLSITIKRFFESFPARYKQPIQIDASGRLDPCLLSVHCQVHALVIYLHEPFVKMSLQNPDLVACANSARVLMGWFHQVSNLNMDIGTVLCANPTMSFALILALRTSVRVMAMNEAFGYFDASKVLRDDLNRVVARLKASQHLPMGQRQILVVADLMRDPSALLPQKSDIRGHTSFARSLQT